MRGCQHNRRAPKACDKKHPTVNIAVLALFSFVCPSVWFLPGEFQLPGFLDENPVGLCAWRSQGALIRYGTPFMWNGNRVPSSTNSFQKSLVVYSVWILHSMPGMGGGSRDIEEWQLKVEEIQTKARKAGYPVTVHWRPPRWSGSWSTQYKRRVQKNCFLKKRPTKTKPGRNLIVVFPVKSTKIETDSSQRCTVVEQEATGTSCNTENSI